MIGTHLPLNGWSRIPAGSSSEGGGLSGSDRLISWMKSDHWSIIHGQDG
jgi:hypothetical protein